MNDTSCMARKISWNSPRKRQTRLLILSLRGPPPPEAAAMSTSSWEQALADVPSMPSSFFQQQQHPDQDLVDTRTQSTRPNFQVGSLKGTLCLGQKLKNVTMPDCRPRALWALVLFLVVVNCCLFTYLVILDHEIAGLQRAGGPKVSSLSDPPSSSSFLSPRRRQQQYEQILAGVNKSLDDLEIRLAFRGRNPRTCHELKERGVSRYHSGLYDVDPDGMGTGEDPMKVYCDLANGITEVIHDSEKPVSVEWCQTPGCFFHAINYQDASVSQIKALISASEKCQQEIRYDCLKAPLKGYGNWLDSSGLPQTYYDGNQSDVHTCGCHSGSLGQAPCKYSPTKEKCNCDVFDGARNWETDQGIITNMTALPITAFRYGLLHEQSQARVTVGRLTCTGTRTFADEGQSCASLRRQGITTSGYYLLSNDHDHRGLLSDVKLAYCDMGLPSAKESIVAQLSDLNKTIAFGAQGTGPGSPGATLENLNVLYGGEYFDGKTFRVPLKGSYRFTFSGTDHNPHAELKLYVNGVNTVLFTDRNEVYLGRIFTAEAAFNLEEGDEVHFQVNCYSPNYNCLVSDHAFYVFGQRVQV